MSPGRWPSVRVPADLVELGVQRVDAGLAGPGRRLVGGRRPSPEAELAVQRADRDDHRQRGAVRVGDDALGPPLAASAGLTSGTTSGTSGSIRNAPELSTATAPCAAADRRPLRRHLVRHVEHRDVDPVEDLLGAAPGPRPPRRGPAASCRPNAATRPAGSRPRRPARVDSRSQHDGADGAGRADHGQGAAVSCSSPGPPVHHGLDLAGVQVERLVRRRRPPRPRRSGATTTEMRISEVEIISMLTPASASAPKNFGGDAGVRAHARADQRDLADAVVVEQRLEADLLLQLARARSSRPGRRRAAT